MNSNLARPYSDIPSSPHTSLLSFHSPQSADLLFTPAMVAGRQHRLEIFCQAGLRSVNLEWTLHRNMVKKSFRAGRAEALPANGFRIALDSQALVPGFYEVRVVLDSGLTRPDGKPVTGVCVFGWDVQWMAIRETRPADFQAFWDKARKRLAAVPVDARQETPMHNFDAQEIGAYNLQEACLPADYDSAGQKIEEVESCKISMAGPDGGRVFAWLAKPKGVGPFPAMLVLPGAGFNARPRPLEHARHGYLAIDIQVHGQDVDLREYVSLSGPGDGEQKKCAEAFYFYNVHLRVLQALNFLAAHPAVDPQRIVVVGGSQGGRLGIVAAGLDSRIAAVVACIINSPNYPEQVWAARQNGLDQSDGMDLTVAPPSVDDEEGRTMAYYDPMNYAPNIHCSVLMNAGLIDPISPPSNVWAVFNRLGTNDKSMIALPGLGHDWSAEFDRRAWRWLDARLNAQ